MDVPKKENGGMNNDVLPRRRFLRNAGLTLASLSVASAYPLGQSAALAAPVHTTLAQATPTDVDIVNYALSLEHLEAAFYVMAVNSGKLSGNVLTIVTTIRNHEQAHVAALTAAVTQLGGTPVAAQKYNFGDMSTQAKILATAETLEGTGVGAYTGAAALITNKAVVLAAAASIEQVEARHYAAIRLLNGSDGAPEAFGPSKTMQEVMAAIQPFIVK